MIRRLSVKNYRSLVDFTWEPGPEALVLGANGSGKSTAIDALNVVRSFALNGGAIGDLIDLSDATAWAAEDPLSFALEVLVEGDTYAYQVEFEWLHHERKMAVLSEKLERGAALVFERDRETVSEFDRGGKSANRFGFPRNNSALIPISVGREATQVRDFADALSRMVAVRPVPAFMEGEAREMSSRPTKHFENFVAWYWVLSGYGKLHQPLSEMLRDVWPEFDSLVLESVGRDTMALTVRFGPTNGSKKGVKLDFQQLSDGERMLIAFYVVAAYQRIVDPTTIIVDEPDNFVSLAELQPWLLKMLDTRPDAGQIIIVSHNPEIIDTMGESRVDYFERADHMSTTRVRKIQPDETGLSLSERIARGWIGE